MDWNLKKNTQGRVLNGDSSDYFYLKYGVQKDEPLSPCLSVVAVEIAIRQNSQIKGIVIGKEETKLLQFSDDTTVT